MAYYHRLHLREKLGETGLNLPVGSWDDTVYLQEEVLLIRPVFSD
jgi:hypothetical protein